MKKKIKMFFSLMSLCFSLAVLCFGVYSAMTVSYSITGSVSYEVNDVFVDLTTKLYMSTSNELTTEAQQIAKFQELTGLPTLPDDLVDTGYIDQHSTYHDGQIVSPGGLAEFDNSGNLLPINYGSYTQGGNSAYAYYIVVEIENMGTETINAQIDLGNFEGNNNTLNSIVKADPSHVEIPGQKSGYLVVGLALKDATQSAEENFDFSVSVNPGEEADPMLYFQVGHEDADLSNVTMKLANSQDTPVITSDSSLEVLTSSQYVEKQTIDNNNVYMFTIETTNFEQCIDYIDVKFNFKSNDFTYGFTQTGLSENMFVLPGNNYTIESEYPKIKEVINFLINNDMESLEQSNLFKNSNLYQYVIAALLEQATPNQSTGYDIDFSNDWAKQNTITIFITSENAIDNLSMTLSAGMKIIWSDGMSLIQNADSTEELAMVFPENVELMAISNEQKGGVISNLKIENWYSDYYCLHLDASYYEYYGGFYLGNYCYANPSMFLTPFAEASWSGPQYYAHQYEKSLLTSGTKLKFCFGYILDGVTIEMANDLIEPFTNMLLGPSANPIYCSVDKYYGEFTLKNESGIQYYEYDALDQSIEVLPKTYMGIPVKGFTARGAGYSAKIPNWIKFVSVSVTADVGGTISLEFEEGTILDMLTINDYRLKGLRLTFNDLLIVNGETDLLNNILINYDSYELYDGYIVKVKCSSLDDVKNATLNGGLFDKQYADGYAVFTYKNA